MGLFGSNKKTFVSSVVYNLAGDINKRPNFLRTTLVGAVMQNSSQTMGQAIARSYQTGPGIKLRTFAQWAERTGYNAEIGLAATRLRANSQINLTALAEAIPHTAAQTVNIVDAEIGNADYSFWAEKWILENRPADLNTAWATSYDPATGILLIQFADATLQSVPITGYDPYGEYLYVIYNLSAGSGKDYSLQTLQMLIYQRGTGNAAYDAMFSGDAWEGNFYPFIPLRLNNAFISPSYYPAIYERNKAAYKKISGNRYDALIDSIADNENLGHIDYAFCMFGVSLNTKENACRKYLYQFFNQLMVSIPGSVNVYESWKSKMRIAEKSLLDWEAWLGEQQSDYKVYKPEPQVIPYPTLPQFNLRIASSQAWTNYNMNIRWNSIWESAGNGLGRAGAKKGDCWLVLGKDVIYPYKYRTVIEESTYDTLRIEHSISVVSIYWQATDHMWRRIQIHGLEHENLVYQGHAVLINAAEALNDTEESGFIIPLHEDTFKSMSLKDATQMATATSYLVFNCYQVVKQKWYQTGLFMVILIIVIVVISIFFPPAGGAAGGSGILGANAAVGASLGFAGTTAIVVGAVANAIAAMILSKIITASSQAILGDKLGAIVGMIASFFALQFGTAMQSGQSMSQAMAQMSQAPNLLKLTLAGIDGISAYMQATIQDTIAETASVLEDYNKSAIEIAAAYEQNLGNTGIVLDSQRLSEATLHYLRESPTTFFNRTLMTGSDIADLSQKLITNFASLTLDLNLQT